MGHTPEFELPFPAPTDPNDPPADLEALADQVETVMLQRLVSADDPRLDNARPPNGAARGVLAGTYPNPTFANGAIATTTPFASALLDGSAATPSMRSLGSGRSQAAAGDHSHFGGDRGPDLMAIPSGYWSGSVTAERRLGWVEVDVTVATVKDVASAAVITTLTEPFRPKRTQFAAVLVTSGQGLQAIEVYVNPDGNVAVSQFPAASSAQVRCSFAFIAASSA